MYNFDNRTSIGENGDIIKDVSTNNKDGGWNGDLTKGDSGVNCVKSNMN